MGKSFQEIIENMNYYMTVSRYDAQTGRIEAHAGGTLSSILSDGFPFVKGKYDQNEYYIDFSSGTPTPYKRPIMAIMQDKITITADGNDTMILSGLPMLCKVKVENGIYNAIYQVVDEVLEWATLMPATYKITVLSFPYQDWESEVVAIAGNLHSK